MGAAKKRRLERQEQRRQLEPRAKPASRLYAPFRQIGHITNGVPFDVQARGTQYVLTTCVGHAVQMYDCARMNLLFVGRETDHPIAAIVSHGNDTLLAAGPHVVAQRRGKEQWRITLGDLVTHLVVFGRYICAATSSKLCVYDAATRELHTEIDLGGGEVTGIAHPPTYLNKVVVTRADGAFEIWNVRTARLVFKRAFESPITAVSCAPVIDVLAFGLLDGTVLVHNVRRDETLLQFRQTGRVQSLSFRSDGVHVLASATTGGDIAYWNLDKGRLQHTQRSAHAASVACVHFLHNQPLLVTSGADNAVRQWLFDSLDGVPRLLRSRAGHHAPPTCVRFYGGSSQFLLSASRDRSLRAVGVHSDAQSAELSQGRISAAAKKLQADASELKLTEITAIGHATARERDWDNVLTAHRDDSAARTWSWKDRRLGAHTLRTTDGAAVSAVAVSHCGNFGIVGSAAGVVDLYNLQSGLLRRSFKHGHRRAVTGIVSDALNDTLVSSSLDGTLVFWDFRAGGRRAAVDVGSGVTAMRYHDSADLIALACDDCCIRVVDLETRATVRVLHGHDNRLSDLTFTDDARWIVSASTDGTLRTWDLPTGHCIDVVRLRSICTALAFSPTGDHLATAHVDSVGVSLWANRAQFSAVDTRRVTDVSASEVAAMPSVGGFGGRSAVALALEGDAHEADDRALLQNETNVEQIASDLQTLSLLPRARAAQLVGLDAVRERNRPRDAPKKPERLPFELGALRDLRRGEGLAVDQADVRRRDAQGVKQAQDERIAARAVAALDSDGQPWAELLQAAGIAMSQPRHTAGLRADRAVDAVVERLKSLGPAQTDTVIASLSNSPDSGTDERAVLIAALTHRLVSQRRDYELVLAWTSMWLKHHAGVVSDALAGSTAAADGEADGGEAVTGELDTAVQHSNGTLRDVLARHKNAIEAESARLSDRLGYCLAVLKFLG